MVSLESPRRPATARPRRTKSWLPTRKWWAATVIAFGAIATLWVTKGEFDKEVMLTTIGAIVQAVATYLVPNLDTAGGVPTRTS